MAPLILKPEYRIAARGHAGQRRQLDWEYDDLLDGLLCGKISGTPMDPQDARMLLALLERLGWNPDANRLAGAMPYLTDRLEKDVLCSLMLNLGFDCRVQRLKASHIPYDQVAGLLLAPDNRFWAVNSTEHGAPVMMRPGTSGDEHEIRLLNMTKKYTFLHFLPDMQMGTSGSQHAQEKFTSRTFSKLSPDLRLALLLTLLSGVLTVTFSILVIFLFNLAVTGQKPQVIGAVLMAAVVFCLVDLCFRNLKAQILGRVSGRFEFLLGNAMFAKLLKLPRHMIDEAPISEQATRLREIEGIRDIFAGPFAIVALEIPGTIILIIAIAVFSPALATLLLAVITVFCVAGLSIIPSLVRRAAHLSAAQSTLKRLQIELIEKREVIARNGLAWTWTEKAEYSIGAVTGARFRLAQSSSILEALSYLFMPSAAACVVFVGAERAIAGVLSGGELVGVTMLTWRAVAPLQQALLVIPKIGDLTRIFRQADMMMRFAEEDTPSIVENIQNKAVRLTAANLFLRGSNANASVLAGVSIDIPKGLLVSVTGVSGSGKSALLGVLSGQIHPQAGSVGLDGFSLSEMSSRELGSRIVLVPQNPMLIYGTLAQNLRFVKPLVSDAQIEAVLNEVGLAELLKLLPDGIHSRIDPDLDASLLSGGIRTAVAVAQAFLMKPSVLLLDEAKEDVDPAIDRALIAAIKLRQNEMTTLIVTHRPSMVRDSDAVLQLSGGRATIKFNPTKMDQAV